MRALKKLHDLRLRNAALVKMKQVSVQVSPNTNIYCEKLEELSDLMIFPECFHGPLKTLWRATCGQQAANCPPLQ